VEKPITVTLAEASELIELARHRGRVLQVGHIERFNPAIRAVRSEVKSPGFIECHRLSPYGDRGTDVDVVLDLMIHDLDMVLSFKPGAVEEVRAAGVPVLSSTIDIANVVYRRPGCENSAYSSAMRTCPWTTRRARRRFCVEGWGPISGPKFLWSPPRRSTKNR
jgi:predicted dehydrogenase